MDFPSRAEDSAAAAATEGDSQEDSPFSSVDAELLHLRTIKNYTIMLFNGINANRQRSA